MLAKEMTELIVKGRVYDLGQPYFPGMPHHPNHPPFAFTLTKKHGDVMYPNQVSSSNDLFTTGGHTGTHLDSLGHISKKGKLFGHVDASRVQNYTSGLKGLGIDVTPPVVRRGILLDVAGALGMEALPHAFPIGPKELEKTAAKESISFKAGDVVLIRTGWARYWADVKKFVANERGAPGVNLEGAKWLARHKMAFTGSDTTAYEKTPAHDLPVHVFLLTQKGIQLMEMLNLEEIARDRIY
ncbi:MAG: cyclase family protein [Deltaproteobacteria bacterium]|nr:cyclase family protein [Deltaproteobacteria bacterium]